MALDSQLCILHVLNHARITGNGIVNATIDLACSQAKLGHQVAIASAGGDYESLLKQENIQHFHLDQRRSLKNTLKLFGRYRHIVQTFQPDVVHTHMMTGVLVAWGYRQYYRLTHGLSGRPYAFVATVHNEFQRNAILMGLADGVIGVSQAVAEAMAQRGVAKNKLKVVLNGTLGSPRQSITEAVAVPALGKPAILTVAGMYRRKGIFELIEAFTAVAETFPEAHLYIVGDGPDRGAFEQAAAASGACDRIHFEGFQQNPQAYMRQADIFVLASHREPFGLVLTEARAEGCAIIASQVDGIPEAIDQGDAGIFVPPQDSKAIAAALEELLSDPEKVVQYQQRAQANLGRFTVERVAKETLATYNALLAGEALRTPQPSVESTA